MNITSNPSTVHPPLGQYAHVVEVPDNARWLVISGQVGIDEKGKLAANARKQSEQALRYILACLRDHGMSKRDLVILECALGGGGLDDVEMMVA